MKEKGLFFLAAGGIFLLLLLFFAAVFPVKADRFLPEGGSIYHEKEMRWERAEKDMVFPSSLFIPATYFERQNSLIVRHAGFRLKGEEGKIYLPYTHFEILPDGKLFLYSGEGRSGFFSAGFLFGLLLLYMGFSLYRKKKKETLLSSREETFFHCFFMVVSHMIFFAIFRFQEPNTYILDSDSNGYFAVIDQILKGDFQSKGVYPAGLGILYLPFIFLLGAEKASDLTPLLPAFSSLFVLPFSFILLYLTGRHFLGRKTALSGLLFWILFSGIFFITESPSHGGIFSPLGFFHYQLGGGNAYIFKSYRMTLLGFSSLTEPFACFFSALCLFLALYMKGGWKKGLLIGGLFGFSCMVRLNLIFFAPAIFYCFLMADQRFFSFRKETFSHTLITSFTAAAGFLLLFSIQLFLNYCYFKDPFTFPYSLHYAELYKGFEWKNIPRSSAFYFQCFAPLLGLFTAGLLVTRRALRSKVFLVLCALPTLLFFCGLVELGQNYRFLMPIYGVLSMGIFLPAFFRKSSPLKELFILFLLFLLLIPVYPVKLFLPVPEMMKSVSPSQWYIPEFWMWLRSWYFVPLLGGVLFFAWRKKGYALGGYFLIFTAFGFFPPPVILFLLSAFLLFFFPIKFLWKRSPAGTKKRDGLC